MKIYVMGSSKEIDRVRAAYMRLRAGGHTITRDWTEVVLSAPGPDSSLTDEVCREVADADLDAVMETETVLLLVPKPGESIGSWVELGAALGALRARFKSEADTYPYPSVIAAGPRVTIFLAATPIQLYATDEEALDALCP